MYSVVDKQTGLVVRKGYKTRQGARRAADKLDCQYGAYRYGVREDSNK